MRQVLLRSVYEAAITTAEKRGTRVLSAVLGICCCYGVCGAQYVPPPPALTVDPCAAGPNPLLPKDAAAKALPVCVPPPTVPAIPAGKPTPADRFPFPSQSVSGASAQDGGKPAVSDQFPFPAGVVPAAPAAGASAPASSAPSKAADSFPYPGETSTSPDAAPEGNIPRYVPDAPAPGTTPGSDGASSSSSSSSSASSAGDTAVPSSSQDSEGTSPDADGRGTGSRNVRLGRRALPKVSAVSPDERVAEDLDVAKFYSDHGNFQAAYLRAKDATKVMPEDAESHFVLAQAAEHLKLREEAATEYALYLKLDPVGDKKSTAQRALSQLR